MFFVLEKRDNGHYEPRLQERGLELLAVLVFSNKNFTKVVADGFHNV